MRRWISMFACSMVFAMTAHAAPGDGQPDGKLVLNAVDPGATGLTQIMGDWAAAELERQGGKYKEHGWWPWGLTAIDYDNDGDLDLLPVHHGSPGGLLLRNNLKETGKLTFSDVTKDVAGEALRHVIADDRPWVWDFDGDGWLDIAGFSDESKPRSFFNRGGKTIEPIPNFTFHPVSHPSEVRDLNGDGYPDLYATSRGGSTEYVYDSALRIFRINLRKAAAEDAPADFAPWFAGIKTNKNNRFLGSRFIRERDLNGDGIPDTVASLSGGYGADALGRYWLADKTGALTDRTAELGLPETGAPIFIDDLTGDGAPDVLIAFGEKAGLYVNDGKGAFSRKEGELTKFLVRRDSYMLRAFPADLDNDGDPDLVVSAPRGGREEVHENLGNGEFVKVLACGGWDSNPVVICDIDNDGLLDVCVGGPKNTISIYRNETPNPGRSAAIFPRMAAPNPYAVGAIVEVFRAGDVERDGARPLLSKKANPDATAVRAGLGDADSFDLRVTFPGAQATGPSVFRGLKAGKRWKATPDGKCVEID